MPPLVSAGIRDALVATMAGPARWPILGQMPSTVATHAKRQLREVLTVKIGRQIANVYAGLKGTNLALWHPPSMPMNVLSKSTAIAISSFGYGDGRTGRDVSKHAGSEVNHEFENRSR